MATSSTPPQSPPIHRVASPAIKEREKRMSIIPKSFRKSHRPSHSNNEELGIVDTDHSPPRSSNVQLGQTTPLTGIQTTPSNIELRASLDPVAMSTSSPDSERRHKRNSLFSRLLSRSGRKDQPPVDDDTNGVVEQLTSQESPSGSPQLHSRSRSMGNVSKITINHQAPTTMNTVTNHSSSSTSSSYSSSSSPDTEQSLRQQLHETNSQLLQANTQLFDYRQKEAAWQSERETLLLQIQSLTQQQQPSISNSNSNSDDDEQEMTTTTTHKDSTYTDSSVAALLELNFINQMSQSSSNYSLSATISTPDHSPFVANRNAHNRRSMAIQESMRINIAEPPFERLVMAQHNPSLSPPPHQQQQQPLLDNVVVVLSKDIEQQVERPATLAITTSPKPDVAIVAVQQTTPISVQDQETILRQGILTDCLEKILYKLIEETSDALFKSFFTSYEYVFTAPSILDTMIQVFKLESPQCQMRICTILKHWLTDCSIPSLCDNSFVQRIHEFMAHARSFDTESYNHNIIVELCEQVENILNVKVMERGGSTIVASAQPYKYPGDIVCKQYVTKRSNSKIKAFLSTSLKSSITASIFTQYNSTCSPPLSPTLQSKDEAIKQLKDIGLGVGSHLLSVTTADNISRSVSSPVAPGRETTRPRSSTWSTPDIFLSIMDAPSKEIAKALTVVDFSIFMCIEPQELMNGVCGKADLKDLRAFNISKMITRFNDISMNVIQTVLNEERLKDRCKVLAKLIKIAKHLHDLRNYNSMMAVYAGISHSSILRLKCTHKILPKHNQKALMDLNKLMDNEENFKNYRTELRSITVPCIPYLGLVLSDMIFIQEGNPDYLPGEVTTTVGGNAVYTFNYTKLKMVHGVIKQLQQYQRNHYMFNADPRLALLLTPNYNIFSNRKVSNNISIGQGDGSTGAQSKVGEDKSTTTTTTTPQVDRLFRSFTMEDLPTNVNDNITWTKRRKDYSAPFHHQTQLLLGGCASHPNLERCHSETNLDIYRSIQEQQTNALLDSIIKFDSSIGTATTTTMATMTTSRSSTVQQQPIVVESNVIYTPPPDGHVTVGNKKKTQRHKSVSTNNIFGVLSPSRQDKDKDKDKDHQRRSSSIDDSPQLRGGVNNYNNYNISPLVQSISSPSVSQLATTTTTTSSTSSPTSTSLFNRQQRKGSDGGQQACRPPHSFPPMSDEGLYQLSMRLEPKGVKYQDLL
ncbi:hypothetical protein SAMD00019534_025650 [Acytostelium subglobosum LB1]|uniref:hypothetical protein n=1 Tax=Acytostelium subglobosum LB1 TaxID=1410327 RepID=UPI0006450543|nr:hypothetical protein SAMD00019534_025650 [Acytostelium subglobosum LB1]GAM19390.1 hypothetical protein SAMD00019534_025650 [Acytostelium subglobosum LB1]|eukprot:XP_012757317.1 hypothetical protein SAMD00019534_025650 [Acytostelium subglobosum LB1]